MTDREFHNKKQKNYGRKVLDTNLFHFFYFNDVYSKENLYRLFDWLIEKTYQLWQTEGLGKLMNVL